ncbi:hypothetical protein, partial [Methylorubrum thiocyanatum]|uniref:hypothetical protein n=1 Tax=Methylorubrum thiocyanatum TaxID=47958 RepID=UPI003F800B98
MVEEVEAERLGRLASRGRLEAERQAPVLAHVRAEIPGTWVDEVRNQQVFADGAAQPRFASVLKYPIEDRSGSARAVADHVGSYASYPAAARQLRQAFG